MKVITANCLLLTLLLTGCVNKISDDEYPSNNEAKKIAFTVDYKMSGIDSPDTKAVSNLGSFAKELIIYDYVNGQEIQEKNYSSSDEDYGRIEISLIDGIHNLVFVGHNSEKPNFLYPTLFFDKVKDTFVYSTQLTVDSNTSAEQSITLSRAVGKIFITATDAIPDDATALRITINDYYTDFNVTTLAASGDAKQEVRTFSYSSANKGVKNSTYSIFCFANDKSYTTDVTIELLGTNNNVLYSNNLHNVPIKKNSQTKITGALFSFVAWGSIVVQGDWDEDIIYPLNAI